MDARLCGTVILSGMESKRRLYVEIRMDEEVATAARRCGQAVKLDVALKQKKVRRTRCIMITPCIVERADVSTGRFRYEHSC